MKPRPLLLLLGGLAALSLGLGRVEYAAAATYNVDKADDEFDAITDCTTPVINECSLREAIAAANANTGVHDTIRLPNTTLTLTIPRSGPNDVTTGDLNITEDVDIVPQLGADPVIDAGGSGGMGDRIFHIAASSGTTLIQHIALRNGYIASESGGAVLVDAGADVVIEDSQITGSSANNGGGIYLESGATVDVDTSEISGNVVTSQSGGGIMCHGTLTVEDSVIRGNTGGSGGGGLTASSNCSATVQRTEISGNTVVNTFLGANGGGVTVGACGFAALTNVTLSGNNAKGSGGGIFIQGAFGLCGPGVLTANNVTVAFNNADSEGNGTGDGGGVYEATNCSGFPSSCSSFQNSIIAGNKDNGSASDCAGDPITSAGYNMINTSRCPVTASQSSDSTADPGLDPVLALNHTGWDGTGIVNDTNTYGLIAGTPTNPSVNSGNGATCATTDQRGVSRIGTCDRGAFEADVCGDGVNVRDPEQCDPSTPICSTQCRNAIPADHNNPFVTDAYRAGLVVAYDACLLPPTGLTDSVSGKAACNVVSSDPSGVCEFDSTSSSAKGTIDITPATSGGGKIDFHLKLVKLKSACYTRQFRMRISLDETLADCSGLPAGSTDSCTIQRTLLDDIVSGSCTVSNTGTCEYTTTFTPTSSGHKVATTHRTAVSIREIKVVDAVTNADAFVAGVLVK